MKSMIFSPDIFLSGPPFHAREAYPRRRKPCRARRNSVKEGRRLEGGGAEDMVCLISAFIVAFISWAPAGVCGGRGPIRCVLAGLLGRVCRGSLVA